MLWSLPDAELTGVLGGLSGLSAQVDAARFAAVREADRCDLGKTAGATSTANWLSGTLRMRPEVARRAVKLANDLDTQLALTAMALRSGEIGADHAQVIAHAIRELPAEAGPQVRDEAVQFLVSHARRFDPKDLAELGRTILNVVDPDLADRVLAKKLASEEAKASRRRERTLTR